MNIQKQEITLNNSKTFYYNKKPSKKQCSFILINVVNYLIFFKIDIKTKNNKEINTFFTINQVLFLK